MIRIQTHRNYSNCLQQSNVKNSSRQRFIQGFTVLELLVVIAMLGILFVIGGIYSFRYRDIVALREAQRQMVKDFERARAYSKRYSYDYKITIDVTNNKYDIAPKNGATGYPEIHSQPVNNAKILGLRLHSGTPITTTTDIIYTAPLGRLDSPDYSIQLGTTAGSSLKTNIDLIGVTGLVITRALE